MAKLLLDKYEKIGDFAIAAKIWAFESSHKFPEGIKYRLALLYKNKRIFGMDYFPTEGHHKNFPGKKAVPYVFETLKKTIMEFEKESKRIMKEGGGSDES